MTNDCAFTEIVATSWQRRIRRGRDQLTLAGISPAQPRTIVLAGNEVMAASILVRK